MVYLCHHVRTADHSTVQYCRMSFQTVLYLRRIDVDSTKRSTLMQTDFIYIRAVN